MVDSVFVCHAFTKSDGTVTTPFFGMKFSVARLNDQWQQVGDKEEDIYFPIAWPVKRKNEPAITDDAGNSAYYLRPGQIESRESDTFEDLAVGGPEEGPRFLEVGAEGNCLIADPKHGIDPTSAWGRFCTSLESKAFKASVSEAGYAPDYIGLECHVHTIELPKSANAAEGSKIPTCLLADNINVFPYEIKKGKTATAAKAATTAKKTNGSSNGASTTEETDRFAACKGPLQEFITKNKGKQLSKGDFVKQAVLSLIQNKTVGNKLGMDFAPVLKDDEKLAILSLELDGFEYDAESKMVQL